MKGPRPVSLLDNLRTNLAARQPTADPFAVGNEPLKLTPGGSFDTGPIVDQSNADDAGGYTDTTALIVPDDDKPAATGPRRRRPLRRWTSQRFDFPIAAADGPPVLVTPSGIDALDIVNVTLVASGVNMIRVGKADNDARAGGYLPNAQPVVIETGPVWVYPLSSLDASSVDVFVVYEDPSEATYTGATGKPCGCEGAGK